MVHKPEDRTHPTCKGHGSGSITTPTGSTLSHSGCYIIMREIREFGLLSIEFSFEYMLIIQIFSFIHVNTTAPKLVF